MTDMTITIRHYASEAHWYFHCSLLLNVSIDATGLGDGPSNDIFWSSNVVAKLRHTSTFKYAQHQKSSGDKSGEHKSHWNSQPSQSLIVTRSSVKMSCKKIIISIKMPSCLKITTGSDRLPAIHTQHGCAKA